MRLIVAATAAFFMLVFPVLADETTTLNVPVGDIVGGTVGYLAVAIAAVTVWGLRFLPPQLYALALTLRVDQLLQRAVQFGVNAVAGAVDGKALSIDVGNAVLKEALAYAILHGGEMVQRFAGSPVDVAEKIWARLELAPEATKPDFAAIADAVEATMRPKAAA